MFRLCALLLCVLCAGLLAGPAAAADPPPALVADKIFIQGDNTLVAEGSVEVFYDAARLTAKRVTYDSTKDRLEIEGPMVLRDGSGTILVADAADLRPDLSEGLIRGARLILDEQLQLAAQTMDRTAGRYTRLSKVTASSCQVCASNPRPLWEIRATRVVHDQQERQIYYDNAQFRLAGVPIFYAPRLRMPDPTVDRATGFLLPSLVSSSALGLGVELPYFIAIGDSRDLTVTPFVSSKGGRTVTLAYREALRNGNINWTGALSQDPIRPGKTRGYFFADGNFALPDDYRAGFKVQTVTDDAYLLDYDIDDTDRLTSGVWVTRVTRDRYFDVRLSRYHSLRASDSNQINPTLVGELQFERRVTPDLIGGQGRLTFGILGFSRNSKVPYDANLDGVTDGRDVIRTSLGIDWRRQEVFGPGLVLGGGFALDADVFAIGQDNSYDSTVTRLVPTASVDLSWPLVRPAGRDGVRYMIEPTIQLVYSPKPDKAVPDDESTYVEFDEGNLFSYSRFPGGDLYEAGLRANIGVTWSRFSPTGSTIRVTAGRILRSEDLGQFSTGSPLGGTRSDWLLAAQITGWNGLSLTNRALFDDNLDFAQNELRAGYEAAHYAVSGGYVWIEPDAAAGRPKGISELNLYGAWQATNGWRVNADGRYDFDASRPTRAGIGLEYRNECAVVDFSLSRRFTSSTSVQPSTAFSLEVTLAGFGTAPTGGGYRKTCSR